MAAVAAVFAWLYRRQAATVGTSEGVPLRNPFSLRSAAKFAAFFAAVLLLVKLVETYAPDRGLYFVAALAGTTDVDAITLSMAQYARDGDPSLAAHSIIIAALTNTVVKAGMVVTLGSAKLRLPVIIATGAILATGAASLFMV
jgi:uncharacterized membrane protein (DUF4010 family)